MYNLTSVNQAQWQALIDAIGQGGGGGGGTASSVSYDNTTSQLTATTVQGAIDEVSSDLDTAIDDINTNTQAITELNSKLIKLKYISVAQMTISANTWTTIVPIANMPTSDNAKLAGIMWLHIGVDASDNYNFIYRMHATGLQVKVSYAQKYAFNLNVAYI